MVADCSKGLHLHCSFAEGLEFKPCCHPKHFAICFKIETPSRKISSRWTLKGCRLLWNAAEFHCSTGSTGDCRPGQGTEVTLVPRQTLRSSFHIYAFWIASLQWKLNTESVPQNSNWMCLRSVPFATNRLSNVLHLCSLKGQPPLNAKRLGLPMSPGACVHMFLLEKRIYGIWWFKKKNQCKLSAVERT